jgi:hypothetical protein
VCLTLPFHKITSGPRGSKEAAAGLIGTRTEWDSLSHPHTSRGVWRLDLLPLILPGSLQVELMQA